MTVIALNTEARAPSGKKVHIGLPLLHWRALGQAFLCNNESSLLGLIAYLVPRNRPKTPQQCSPTAGVHPANKLNAPANLGKASELSTDQNVGVTSIRAEREGRIAKRATPV